MPPNKRQTHKPPFRLPRRRTSKTSVLWAIAVSAALHLMLLLGSPASLYNPREFDTSDANDDREFSLNVVDEEEEREKEEELEERQGQFVSQPAPQKEERPDEARFLDQYDSKTDKEMARRDPGLNQTPGPGRSGEQVAGSSSRSNTQPSHRPERRREPVPPKPSDSRPSDSQQEPQDSEEAATAESTAEEEPSEASEESIDLEEAETAEEGLVEKSKSSESNQASKPDASALFPSMESAQAALGGGSVDYLRDVEEGDKTLLNRKQSRYWSFMNRLKEQVVQEWSPSEEYRRRDPHGKVYGVKDRFTNLRITLNGDGSLRSIYVAQTSELDFYDEEAVRAVRAAAPFPNPPEGMKDKDGLIHINFGFVLDIRTGSMRDIRIRRR